jgi:hypothetical protein
MPVSPHRLLEFVATAYDEHDDPITPATAADEFDTTTAVVAERFERLADCELVRRVEGGYRPTVTGREFLALDLDEGVVVVDPQE